MPRRGWLRWSSLTQVERIGLYTRQSLYFVLIVSGSFILLFAVDEDWNGDHTELAAGGAVILALAFSTLAALLDRYPEVRPLPRRRLALLIGLSAIYVVYALVAWPPTIRAAALSVTAASLALTIGTLPGRRIAWMVVGASVVVAAIHDLSGPSIITALCLSGAFVFTTRASLWLFAITRDLDRARGAQSELAVAEERLRFSRDVHDVLGRRLSTIAVQAELAATLASRGDDRAPERMLEVREVAHQALREARELARGYRATNFGQELEGARSLLHAAGIDVVLEVDALPHGWHEAAGWVVREAVTNVLRHSDATSVRVAYEGGSLLIVSDGVRTATSQANADASAAGGAGLHGLRERLAPLGGSLTAGPGDDRRWTVIARLPGAGPLSHRASSVPDA